MSWKFDLIMVTEEDYVSFETAKLLKEKGFDEFCSHFYKTEKYLCDCSYGPNPYVKNSDFIEEYTAPTLQTAMKWLRKKHNLFIQIEVGETNGVFWYDFDIIPVGACNVIFPEDEGVVTYAEPEEALKAAIKYCLEKLI